MSHVTDLFVSLPILEEEKIAEVNKYFRDTEVPELVSVEDEKLPQGWYGGSKFLQCAVFVGAYNYLDIPGFINHVKNITWESPEEVQILLKDEHEDKFSLIEPFVTSSNKALLQKVREIVRDKVKNNPFNSGVSEIANAANNGYSQAIFDLIRELDELEKEI